MYLSAQDQYYQFAQQQTQLAGQAYTFFTRQALGDWGEHETLASLLAERMRIAREAHVLNLGCGFGLIGTVAAKSADSGHVTLLDSHCVAVEASRRTLQANRCSNAHVDLSDCGQAVQSRTFDTVLVALPKGRAVWEQTLCDAANALHIGGDLYLAGANRSGIKSAAKYLERVLGNATVLGYKGSCRVVRAVKEGPTSLPDTDYYTWREVEEEVDGHLLRYVTKPGLFSWERLDDGTRLLIEVLRSHSLRRADRVLDLGCGTGVLTLFAAEQARTGAVTAVDVDVRAVEATRRTLGLNRVSHATVALSDAGQALAEQTFDAVVTNPPFHQERETVYGIAEQFIHDAARLLDRRGRLYLVANSFLQYRPIIEAAFGSVEVLHETNRFKVWHAVRT